MAHYYLSRRSARLFVDCLPTRVFSPRFSSAQIELLQMADFQAKPVEEGISICLYRVAVRRRSGVSRPAWICAGAAGCQRCRLTSLSSHGLGENRPPNSSACSAG